MSQPLKQDIMDALRRVVWPPTGTDVVSAGLVGAVVIREGKIGFALSVPEGMHEAAEKVRDACQQAVESVPGVASATVVLTSDAAPAEPPSPQKTWQPPRAAQWNRAPIAGVKRVIAVASGKGGVGKSTVTVNLAHALAAKGESVAILDADIYGPSIPLMMGLSGKPEVHNGQLVPLERDGIQCLSFGFIAPEAGSVVWRAPMITKALQQMLRGGRWEERDTLLIDLPPGTGDIHLSLVQQAPLDGAVIVSTPQEVALIDARRAVDMFRKVDVPVLGLIENMSYFLDPATGSRSDIFGHGGVRKEAEKLGLPFLGEIPLDMRIREAGDRGEQCDTSFFSDIAERLRK